jgi:hypothetical protein
MPHCPELQMYEVIPWRAVPTFSVLGGEGLLSELQAAAPIAHKRAIIEGNVKPIREGVMVASLARAVGRQGATHIHQEDLALRVPRRRGLALNDRQKQKPWFEQFWLFWQSAFVRHCTQWSFDVLQSGNCANLQSELAKHWTQRSVVVSQTLLNWLFAQSALARHWTQYPLVVSHLASGAWQF